MWTWGSTFLARGVGDLSTKARARAGAARRKARHAADLLVAALGERIGRRLGRAPEPAFPELDALRRGLIAAPPPTVIERLFAPRQIVVRGAGGTIAVSLSSRLQIALVGILAVGTVGFAASLLGTVSDRLRIHHLGHEVADLRETVSITGRQAEADRARLRLFDRVLTDEAVERWGVAEVASADREALASQQAEIDRLRCERDRAVAQLDKAWAERDAAWTANLQVLLQLDARTQSAIAEVEGLISSTGLNPDRMIKVRVGNDPGAARGGPFVPWHGPLIPAASGIELRQASSVARSLERLQALSDILMQLPLASPVAQVEISNGYGFRMDPFTGRAALHEGIDLRSRDSSLVYATAAGTVAFAGWQGEYGNTVDIDHGFGLATRYAHLSRIDVKAGQRISLHQLLGQIGATGRATGAHLHYEVRVDGRPRNPVNFLKADRYVPEVDRNVPEANIVIPKEVVRTAASGGSAGIDHR